MSDDDCKWAGITCLGDATIILGGASTVKGCYEYYAGISVPEDKTLKIQGDGSLTAAGGRFYGAGIGGGYGSDGACGTIAIEGGAITAAGGGFAAGIGSGYQSSCEAVFVAGGSVTASGGSGAAGIGGGYDGDCGNISITGVFTIIGIEFNDAGKAVVVTPPLVNGEGFALSILATDRCDGEGAAATSYPLDPSGKTTIDETVSGSRFSASRRRRNRRIGHHAPPVDPDEHDRLCHGRLPERLDERADADNPAGRVLHGDVQRERW